MKLTLISLDSTLRKAPHGDFIPNQPTTLSFNRTILLTPIAQHGLRTRTIQRGPSMHRQSVKPSSGEYQAFDAAVVMVSSIGSFDSAELTRFSGFDCHRSSSLPAYRVSDGSSRSYSILMTTWVFPRPIRQMLRRRNRSFQRNPSEPPQFRLRFLPHVGSFRIGLYPIAARISTGLEALQAGFRTPSIHSARSAAN